MDAEIKMETKKRKLSNTYLTSKCSNLSDQRSLKLKKKCLENLTDIYKHLGFFCLFAL